MTQKIRVSAPGKLILLGEHAVVYGKPAIISAVNKRCFVEIIPRKDQKIKITSVNLNESVLVSIEEINSKFSKAQKKWVQFDQKNDSKILKSITANIFDYPQIIIGQFFNYFNKPTPLPLPLKGGSACLPGGRDEGGGFDLIIDSQIPPGSGMGSSAALAVSMIGALLLNVSKKLDKKIINEIALLAEQKKHGHPSGGDNTASVYGGLIWFKKNQDLKLLDIKLSPRILDNFYLLNTGTPRETTGEMVSLVRKQYESNPKQINEIFNKQEILVTELYKSLNESNQKQLLTIIKEGEANLEKLGVVSPFVKKIIRDIEKSGGAAKICGGGGKTRGTGIVLMYHQNLQKLEKVLQYYSLTAEQLVLGVEGCKKEI